ncbi:hypothetical protein AJ79_04320 [Helicocarpus griseus UAMH5409]|uniref:Fungal-type protein kinase domain-containing protein n=1 Tax=Helicocarpus griseus UAMH5409 TaxID=1447875 RepID=A0A2B7XUS8_9EURO|nr:hypothetical protein AJ79_04320 [Helicocarpus griseus UAMH5409]
MPKHKAPYMVHTSFAHPLYQLEIAAANNDYRTLNVNSLPASTKDVDASRALEEEHPDTLLRLGRQGLEKIRKIHPMKERIAQNEGTHFLETEADVLDASRLYLLHPVNIAIGQLLRGGIKLVCKREHTASNTARTDILWVHQHGEDTTDVAVLEFKNTYILHENEFRAAMGSDDQAEGMVYKAMGTGSEKTLLNGNAIVVSKQARKYHQALGVADVALFDWNNMFVFDFSGMSETVAHPKLARGIWFSEAGQNHRNHETFRAFLLGFLIRALHRLRLTPGVKPKRRYYSLTLSSSVNAKSP